MCTHARPHPLPLTYHPPTHTLLAHPPCRSSSPSSWQPWAPHKPRCSSQARAAHPPPVPAMPALGLHWPGASHPQSTPAPPTLLSSVHSVSPEATDMRFVFCCRCGQGQVGHAARLHHHRPAAQDRRLQRGKLASLVGTEALALPEPALFGSVWLSPGGYKANKSFARALATTPSACLR